MFHSRVRFRMREHAGRYQLTLLPDVSLRFSSDCTALGLQYNASSYSPDLKVTDYIRGDKPFRKYTP
jgi:hypothetical protein